MSGVLTRGAEIAFTARIRLVSNTNVVPDLPVLDGASDLDDLSDQFMATDIGEVAVDRAPFLGENVRVRAADAAVLDLD